MLPLRACWNQHFEMQVSRASCFPSPFSGPEQFGVGEQSSRTNRVNIGVDLHSCHREVRARSSLCVTNAGTQLSASAGLNAHRNAWGYQNRNWSKTAGSYDFYIRTCPQQPQDPVILHGHILHTELAGLDVSPLSYFCFLHFADSINIPLPDRTGSLLF